MIWGWRGGTASWLRGGLSFYGSGSRCRDDRLGSWDRLVRQANSNSKEQTRSILLIDDDVALCTLMAEFFAVHEFRVEAVHDGASGLASAFQGKHDLVLLDVMLPVV